MRNYIDTAVVDNIVNTLSKNVVIASMLGILV